MTNVIFSRKEFESLLGKPLIKELEEKISLFGTPLESLTKDEIEVEIFPNRPDLISLQGYIRSFKQFISPSKNLQKYKTERPKLNYKVKIDSSVNEVRPFTACAIVTNLSLDDGKIKQIIELQEKLHNTVGRNRKKVAIGVYPLEKITLPIQYLAREPDKIRFKPLESDKEMTGYQILNKHPAGKEYASLLSHYDKFPIFVDAKENILSMPPIINSHETGKITEKTKEVFVECSGSHFQTLQKTLNIIVTTLSDMGGKIHQMELEYKKEKIITPNLISEKMKFSLENANKLLGLNLKEQDAQKLLEKMGIEYKNKTAQIPAWRTDVLHEVDLIEDIAIAYGYNNFQPELPQVVTIGEEAQTEKFKSKLAELLLGLGLLEISTYHLIKQNEAEKESVELENSKTDYKFLRPNLLIPALRIFSENKDNEYPQEIFEIGTVFKRDENQETKIKEIENLIIVLSPANFTKIKQTLDYILRAFGLKTDLEETINSKLIAGRAAEIKLRNKKIGIIGEVHPETLKEFGIKMPLAILEISIEEIYEEFKN